MKHVTALKLATSLLLCGSALSVAVDASAQEAAVDVSRNSTVMSRPRPAYDPLGIRVRSFFIYPSLSVGGQYDSNINATPNNTKATSASSPRRRSTSSRTGRGIRWA